MAVLPDLSVASHLVDHFLFLSTASSLAFLPSSPSCLPPSMLIQYAFLSPLPQPFASARVLSGALSLATLPLWVSLTILWASMTFYLRLSPKWMSLVQSSLLSFRPKHLEASRNFHLDQHANTELMIFSFQTYSSYKPTSPMVPISSQSYKPRVEGHLKLVSVTQGSHQIACQIL